MAVAGAGVGSYQLSFCNVQHVCRSRLLQFGLLIGRGGDEVVLRLPGLVYGVSAFVISQSIWIWFVFFIADLWHRPAFPVIPSVDAPARNAVAMAITLDVLLIALFAVQHSVMARRSFKRWLAGWLPSSLERATYVHGSNLAMLAPDGLLATDPSRNLGN